MTEKEIKKAVEVIVADVLYFNGEAPLRVASRTPKITDTIIKRSEGYKDLVKGLK